MHTKPVISSSTPTSVTTTILQPYMSNINSTGTSGFRSPAITSRQQLNSGHSIPASFPSCISSSSYQFPSPSTSFAISSGNTRSVPSVLGEEARFLASNSLSLSSSSSRNRKRKVSRHNEHNEPNKVFIDEERMSAHLQSLNLDNNNLTWHPDFEHDQLYSDTNNHLNDSSEDEDDMTDKLDPNHALPQLKLSDDLKLSFNTKQLLPKAIMEEMKKPLMQIMLWRPPSNLMKEILPSLHTDSLSMPGTSRTSQSGDVNNIDMIDDSSYCDPPREWHLCELPSIPLILPDHHERVTSRPELFDSIDDDMDL